MEKYSLEWQMERVRKQFDEFKIESVEKTDSMMLIKATVYCPVYFAFYGNYIVCSGDYGEWQFWTTWKTFADDKPQIPLDFYYLLGKLSHNCKKHIWESECCYDKFKEWKEEFIEEYKADNEDDIDENFLEEFEETSDDVDCEDEWSYISSLMDFGDFLENNGFRDIFEYSFWDYGNLLNWQLVCQLVMFEKIVDYFNKLEEKNNE